jgi:prolyl-tRNA editing enzyme YbaK/EbsC (Cys-tRNA(Pro) deacylase)
MTESFADWDPRDRVQRSAASEMPATPSEVYQALTLEVQSHGGTQVLEITAHSDPASTAAAFGASHGLPPRHVAKLVLAIEDMQRQHFR